MQLGDRYASLVRLVPVEAPFFRGQCRVEKLPPTIKDAGNGFSEDYICFGVWLPVHFHECRKEVAHGLDIVVLPCAAQVPQGDSCCFRVGVEGDLRSLQAPRGATHRFRFRPKFRAVRSWPRQGSERREAWRLAPNEKRKVCLVPRQTIQVFVFFCFGGVY